MFVRWVMVGFLVMVSVLSLSACTNQSELQSAETSMSGVSVERGRYLATIMACNDCHTPFKMGDKGPEPDMSRMLSGHPANMKLPPAPAAQGPWIWTGSATNTAFAGPWGVSYSMNLTPDKHGMAVWTEEMFVSAMRTGRHFGQPGARPIAPPMPWQGLSKATDDDLKSIFAYLRTVAAIPNVVPDYQPPAH